MDIIQKVFATMFQRKISFNDDNAEKVIFLMI